MEDVLELNVSEVLVIRQDLFKHRLDRDLVVVNLLFLLQLMNEPISELSFQDSWLHQILFCIEDWNLISL